MFTFAVAKLHIKNQKGFSLVELMVVVAIIGILSSMAVPSLNRQIAKARQAEAKTSLSGLYTAEKAFYAEYNTYDPRFEAIGYKPEGKLRYNVGFSGGPLANASNGYNPTAAISAATEAISYCGAAGAMAKGCTMLDDGTGGQPPGVPAAAVTAIISFTGGAIANLMGTGNDTWTMDNNKILTNTTDGIN